MKKFRLSFCHLYKETHFNYAELNSAVKGIGNILNDRPVSLQRTKSDSQDTDFPRPLMPNMSITWRNATGPPSDYEDVNDRQLQKSFILYFFLILFSFFQYFRAITAVCAHCAPPRQIGLIPYFLLVNPISIGLFEGF